MSKCELYKDTHITFKVYGYVYTAGMKILYQTFTNKVIEVFYNGEWYPARIIGEESKKKMLKVNENLICSKDLLLKRRNSIMPVGELKVNDEVASNSSQMDYVQYSETGETTIRVIEETDIESDWLFGIEFLDSRHKYYTLTNGLIVSTK